MRRPIPPGLMTQKELAAYLGINFSTIYRWTAAGAPRAPNVRIGKMFYYTPQGADQWARAAFLMRRRHVAKARRLRAEKPPSRYRNPSTRQRSYWWEIKSDTLR